MQKKTFSLNDMNIKPKMIFVFGLSFVICLLAVLITSYFFIKQDNK